MNQMGKRRGCGLRADFVAGPFKMMLMADIASARQRKGDIDQTDGLFGIVRGGSGNSGGADADI